MENKTQTVGQTTTESIGVSEMQYIRQWNNHIQGAYLLCFNGNKELELEIKQHLDALMELIPKVAEEKRKKGAFEDDN